MSINRRIVLIFLALSTLYLPALAEDDYSINVSADKFLGVFLTNESGYALYYFSDDAGKSGESACYGECAAKWPAFYAEVITVPESLIAIDFATVTRTDGSKQTTYKGWPLYLYAGDKAPGSVSGNGRDENRWHIIDPQDMPQSF